MSKNTIKERGIGKVYRFTLSQLYKNKSNRVVFGIFIVICLLAVPIAGLLTGKIDFSGNYTPDLVEISKNVFTYDDYMGFTGDNFDARLTVQMGYSILLLMLITFSTTYIMRAIIDEKSSKLVELLMVSVSSKALIFGKILAVMTFIFSLLLACVLALATSALVSGFFMDNSFVVDGIFGNILSAAKGNGLMTILVLLITLVISYFVYSMIAALVGAGCSGIDEMSNAYSSVMIILMSGYLVSIITVGFASKGLGMFLSIFPVTAPFALPTSYFMGNINFVAVAISWVIQVGLIYALYIFSGRVYDQLIIYKGSRLKLLQIFRLAKTWRKGA